MVIDKRANRDTKKKKRVLMTWSYAWGENADVYEEEEKQRAENVRLADLERQAQEEEDDAAIERTIEMWGAQRVL